MTGQDGGIQVTCEQCFFRRFELCALPGDDPCPTFRPVALAAAPTSAVAPGARPPAPVGHAVAAA